MTFIMNMFSVSFLFNVRYTFMTQTGIQKIHYQEIYFNIHFNINPRY